MLASILLRNQVSIQFSFSMLSHWIEKPLLLLELKWGA